jgi:outer membrane murein-binding lipoprotein Lpp
LTKEEIERIIDEKLKTAAQAATPSSAVGELASRVAKLEQEVAQLIQKPAATRPAPVDIARLQPIDQTLKAELGTLAELLEFRSEKDQLILKPKKFLGRQNFRSVIEIVRKHGGRWSPQTQTFIVKS